METWIHENNGPALITDRMGVEVRPFDDHAAAAEFLGPDQFPLRIVFLPPTTAFEDDTSPSTGKMSGGSPDANSNSDKSLPALGGQTSGDILYNQVWPGVLNTKLQSVGATESLENHQCEGSTFMVTDACGVQVDLKEEYMPEVTRFPLKLHFVGTHHGTRQNLDTILDNDEVGNIGTNCNNKPSLVQQYTIEISYKSLLTDVINKKLQEMSIPTDAENRPTVLITDHTGVQVHGGVPDHCKFPLKFYLDNTSIEKQQDVKKTWWKLPRSGSKESNKPDSQNRFRRTLSRLGATFAEGVSSSLSMSG